MQAQVLGCRAGEVDLVVHPQTHESPEGHEALEASVAEAPTVVHHAIHEVDPAIGGEGNGGDAADLGVLVQVLQHQGAVRVGHSVGAVVSVPVRDERAAWASDAEAVVSDLFRRRERAVRLDTQSAGNDGTRGLGVEELCSRDNSPTVGWSARRGEEGAVGVCEEGVLEAVAVHVNAVADANPVRVGVVEVSLGHHVDVAQLSPRNGCGVRRVGDERVGPDGKVALAATPHAEACKGDPVDSSVATDGTVRVRVLPGVRERTSVWPTGIVWEDNSDMVPVDVEAPRRHCRAGVGTHRRRITVVVAAATNEHGVLYLDLLVGAEVLLGGGPGLPQVEPDLGVRHTHLGNFANHGVDKLAPNRPVEDLVRRRTRHLTAGTRHLVKVVRKPEERGMHSVVTHVARAAHKTRRNKTSTLSASSSIALQDSQTTTVVEARLHVFLVQCRVGAVVGAAEHHPHGQVVDEVGAEALVRQRDCLLVLLHAAWRQVNDHRRPHAPEEH
mmetsp:Transcript_11923/g.27463  ORF Transcript_11923/g.27463 Transcript_11923/m.27463 type:complete len:499 (-) Transcript_11923:990-2486(-)